MTGFTFTPATREQAKARIALEGPSGSGKTYTALAIATAMADRVALIDTERGSASKYALGKSGKGFAFDTLQMSKFDPRDLVAALAAAGSAGYGAAIVDSLSHFWMGKGGMLELVDSIGKRSGSGGGFGGWKEARPFERDMIDALLAYPGHIIVTMRTKSEWLIDDSGPKKKITKIGTKAEQREGIEYEFDIVGDLDLENTLIMSKSRCPELSGAVINRPGADMAAAVMEWLSDGTSVPEVPDLVAEAMADELTYESALKLHAKAERYRMLGAAIQHPATKATLSLADLIIERGRAAKAAAARPAVTAIGSRKPGAKQPAPAEDGVPAVAQVQQLRRVQPGEGDQWATPAATVAAATADVPAESLTPSGRDYLHEAHAAPDAATVRLIWQDAKGEGARAEYLAQIAEVSKEKAAAEQQPSAADSDGVDAQTVDEPSPEEADHAAAVAELRRFAAENQIADIDADAHGALGAPLEDVSAAAIRGLLAQLRGTAA